MGDPTAPPALVAVCFVLPADIVQHDGGGCADGVQLSPSPTRTLVERRYDLAVPYRLGPGAAVEPAAWPAFLTDADVDSVRARDGALSLRASLPRLRDAAILRAISQPDRDAGRVYPDQESDSVAGRAVRYRNRRANRGIYSGLHRNAGRLVAIASDHRSNGC